MLLKGDPLKCTEPTADARRRLVVLIDLLPRMASVNLAATCMCAGVFPVAARSLGVAPALVFASAFAPRPSRRRTMTTSPRSAA